VELAARGQREGDFTMQTATAPASIRAQAFDICRAHGFGLLGRIRAREAGDDVSDLLLALERTFRIDLEVDELWPEACVVDLVQLVELKVTNRARHALLPANGNEAGGADILPFRARVPVFPPPNARQLRDRARRARRRQRAADTLEVTAKLALVAAFIGGVAALGIGVTEIVAARL
jgi:hypothetical protein